MAARKQSRLDAFLGTAPPTGPALVLADLSDLLVRISVDHPIFGPLEDRKLRMPRTESSDGRTLTWPKFLRSISSAIVNDPRSRHDCWFASATKDDGYHEVKISVDGSAGKYRTHRLLSVLVDPSVFGLVEERSTEAQAIHRCGRGKGAGVGDLACINPHHVYFGDCATNQDTKGCKYGAAFLCPHTPKCIWTDAGTGRFKPCRNDPTKHTCTCDGACFA